MLIIKRLKKIQESFLFETFFFWRSLCKNNASMHTDSCREKMEYTLLRENHIIEKGMSMRNPKKGFGQEKVLALLKRLIKYKQLYHEENPLFLRYPLTTVDEYIAYTKKNGIYIPEIESLFNQLAKDVNISTKPASGIIQRTKEDILKEKSINFSHFLESRHSIRYFSKNVPSQDLLDKALTLAQRTPSACNRQGWKVHQFIGSKCTDLLKWQGGARGFEEEPTIAFLVTANLRAFLHHEPFQAYVDGGMYAMSLIYAIHEVGLGSIPLSCGFQHSKISKLYKMFDIPKNEVPIEIIAVGEMLDSFNVAASSRKDISITTVKH